VKQLQFKNPPLVLAATVSGDAIFAEIRRDQSKFLVLNVNLDKSDLAFRTAFPIMVANALSWFAGQNGELRESMTTGSTANVDLSVNADIDPSKLIVRSPSGKIFSLQIASTLGQINAEPMALATGLDAATVGRMAPEASADGSGKLASPSTIAGHIGPFQEVGIWTVAEQADNASPSTIAEPAPLYEVAVNLSSARESDLQPSKVLQDLTQDAPSLTSWLGRPVWFYLICVACALTMLEWIFYQRRVIT